MMLMAEKDIRFLSFSFASCFHSTWREQRAALNEMWRHAREKKNELLCIWRHIHRPVLFTFFSYLFFLRAANLPTYSIVNWINAFLALSYAYDIVDRFFFNYVNSQRYLHAAHQQMARPSNHQEPSDFTWFSSFHTNYFISFCISPANQLKFANLTSVFFFSVLKITVLN